MTLEQAMAHLATKIGAVCDKHSGRSMANRTRDLIVAYSDLALVLTELQPQIKDS